MNHEQALQAAASIYLSNWRDRPPSEQEWVMDSAQRMVRAYLEARRAFTPPAPDTAGMAAERLLSDFAT